MNYLIIIPILAFLIVIHELGHFFAARSVGVQVEEFGIGLPPRIKGWRKGGVLWSLNALPIGGFVRVKGEDANDREPGSMQVASPWARAWFLLAGPMMNLLAALIISMILVATTGVQTERPFISNVAPDSPAMMAGWQPGDRIVSINGQSIDSTAHAIDVVRANAGSEIRVVIQRGDESLDTSLTPRKHPPEGQGSTGITFGDGRFSDVQVDRIRPGTPAAEAGLQPGDRIIAIDGVKIEAMAQAMAMLNARIGAPVSITYERSGTSNTIDVTLPEASLPVTEITAGSPAARSGLYATDEIVTINGQRVDDGQVLIDAMITHSGEPVEIGYIRTTESSRIEDTTILHVPDVSALDRSQVLANLGMGLQQPSGFWQLGVIPIGHVSFEPVPANRIVQEGWNQFAGLITGTYDALRTTFSGGAPLDSLVGPIGLGQMTGELLNSANGNTIPILLNLSMLISISLGIFNLLPIPALDGGRLIFVAIEILRGGKRVPPEKEGYVHMLGMILLLGLMFFIAYGDVARLLHGDAFFK